MAAEVQLATLAKVDLAKIHKDLKEEWQWDQQEDAWEEANDDGSNKGEDNGWDEDWGWTEEESKELDDATPKPAENAPMASETAHQSQLCLSASVEYLVVVQKHKFSILFGTVFA
eukprot:Colp12_sorted_trinity150504_noHs@22035